MAKDNGGHAFPLIGMGSRAGQSFDQIYEGGMSLRDYFAAKALQGFCANASHSVLDGPQEFREGAKEAYLMADAMIAERAK